MAELRTQLCTKEDQIRHLRQGDKASSATQDRLQKYVREEALLTAPLIIGYPHEGAVYRYWFAPAYWDTNAPFIERTPPHSGRIALLQVYQVI